MIYISGITLFAFSFLWFCFPGEYVLIANRDLSLFRTSPDYFLSFVDRPGGLLEYLGSFLGQFFRFRLTGALLLAVMVTSAFYLGNKLITGSPNNKGLIIPGAITPILFPDYKGIIIPANITPLNFEVWEEGKRFFALLEGENGPSVMVKAKQGIFSIPPKKWTRFLEGNRGSKFMVKIYKNDAGDWTAYESSAIQVASEPIDPNLVYRLIPPSYETWSNMGLYQRDLTSFREQPIVENRNIEDNCVNCHSFNNGSSEQMLFHIRGSVGGTMIKMGDGIEKVDLKRDRTLSAGVYPAWHPSGNFIAFSTNRIEQYFHALQEKSIEVLDRQSDLILVDLINGKIEVPARVNSDDTDSYHTWARSSRWIVFSSRRYDGRYTKLYISYLDREGQFQKAFLLPQRDPRSNGSFLYSYNRPELITGPVQENVRRWVRTARKE